MRLTQGTLEAWHRRTMSEPKPDRRMPSEPGERDSRPDSTGSLENARHERFAQLVASGKSATQAYAEAGYSAKDADTAGPRLSGNVGVAARIAALKAAQADKCEFDRDELRKFLVGVLKAKPSEADADNPLCDLVMTKMGPAMVFPSKLQAAAQLAKLCGWNEPEKIEHTGKVSLTLEEYEKRLQEAKR